MHTIMSLLLNWVRQIRDAAVSWHQSAFGPFTSSYRPELHYMRGPGPKWRQKHPR